jgi:hypothetical protein
MDLFGNPTILQPLWANAGLFGERSLFSAGVTLILKLAVVPEWYPINLFNN